MPCSALGLGLTVGLVGGGLALAYAGVRSIRHPANRPSEYRKSSRSSGTRIVVCAGDSITHGAVSFDYVAALDARMAPLGFRFVNAGINGDLAWNLARRVDGIVACDPDVITVLIGTNDVMGSTVPAMARGQRIAKGLPQSASLEWYEENLRGVVARLQSETRARIALLTLPLLGDVLDSPIDDAVRRGSDIVRRVARDTDVTLLDFHELLDSRARASTHRGRADFRPGARSFWWMARAPLYRYLGRMSFDRISDGIGLQFTTDLVHLNERSGQALVSLVEEFVRGDGAARQSPSE